jgi:hypothetical protein
MQGCVHVLSLLSSLNLNFGNAHVARVPSRASQLGEAGLVTQPAVTLRAGWAAPAAALRVDLGPRRAHAHTHAHAGPRVTVASVAPASLSGPLPGGEPGAAAAQPVALPKFPPAPPPHARAQAAPALAAATAQKMTPWGSIG